MTSAYLWPIIMFVLGGIALWRAEAIVRTYLRQQLPSDADRHAAQRERQLEADIAERTLDAAAELREAELKKKTAELNASRNLINALKDERIRTERTTLHARMQANVRLAEEFAREQHKRILQNDRSPVEEYERYIKLADEHDLDRVLPFDQFVLTLQDAK